MMLVFLSSFSLYYLNNEEENARVMRVLSLFWCKKTFLPFFHFFFVFWSLLSFFLSCITTRKRSFFAPFRALCVYSFAAALSPLCEKKRAFHVLKEEEEEEEQSFVDRRVRVIGKAALFFLKTGEKKKEEFPREFH